MAKEKRNEEIIEVEANEVNVEPAAENQDNGEDNKPAVVEKEKKKILPMLKEKANEYKPAAKRLLKKVAVGTAVFAAGVLLGKSFGSSDDDGETSIIDLGPEDVDVSYSSDD